MKWPEPEGFVLIPEGHYEFRLNREPELEKFSYQKDGQPKDGRRIVIYAIGLNDQGEFSIKEKIAAFDPRYRELCDALKVEHGKDISMAGTVFQADVKHEVDKTNPNKHYARLYNFTAKNGDDIPF